MELQNTLMHLFGLISHLFMRQHVQIFDAFYHLLVVIILMEIDIRLNSSVDALFDATLIDALEFAK